MNIKNIQSSFYYNKSSTDFTKEDLVKATCTQGTIKVSQVVVLNEDSVVVTQRKLM